ncbi:hypothetical protein HEB29_000873 [Streptomyces fulvorobeus]|uniref:Uncharacterized protein n=1 Tax=Streptomyces fulvorobeus TaxID=284028 RepID=A0A7Y9H8J4_9ACTN|nr:hypothetical protein [Streptomyces fulvorobeus]
MPKVESKRRREAKKPVAAQALAPPAATWSDPLRGAAYFR